MRFHTIDVTCLRLISWGVICCTAVGFGLQPLPAVAQEAAKAETRELIPFAEQLRLVPNSRPVTLPSPDPYAPGDRLHTVTPAELEGFIKPLEELKAQYERQLEELRRHGAVDPNILQAKGLVERSLRQMQIQAARGSYGRAVPALPPNDFRPLAPLPDDAITQVFTLKNGKAKDMAPVIAQIVGDRGVRLAVDERTNAIVVSGSENTCKIVEALLLKLDQTQTAETGKTQPAGETLQLRVLWLLDGLGDDEGQEPNPSLVSPQVVEALHELGFESPRVVCQQVSTFTMGGNNSFGFEVPVLINQQLYQLSGQGLIMLPTEERFPIQFRVNVTRPDGQQGSQLSGSIYSPLSHYTVVGTTTFVAPANGGTTTTQRQHLSAFVVYLDRARKFSAKNEKSAAKAADSSKEDPFDF